MSGPGTGIWVRSGALDDRVQLQHGPGWPPDRVHGDFTLSADAACELAWNLLDAAAAADPAGMRVRLFGFSSELDELLAALPA